jgi:hypothetical protein
MDIGGYGSLLFAGTTNAVRIARTPETSAIEPEGRGVLGHPLSRVTTVAFNFKPQRLSLRALTKQSIEQPER